MADEKKIAEEKKIADEKLSNEGEVSTEELDKVAGGDIVLGPFIKIPDPPVGL